MAQKAILAIEDDDIFAAYLEAALTELGYMALQPVATGEDAMAQAKASKPDLILMDINLAGEMNGIAAADRIRSFSDVPIIYLTGHSEDSFLEQAGVTAPYGYLIKPVSRRELAAAIEMALHRYALDMKLKESEERYRGLFETCRDSILLVNQETIRILGANPAACKLYGYSLEEFVALKITDVSAEPEKTEEAVRQSISDVPFRLHRKKDGTVFPVQISGSYFTEGTHRLNGAFIRDITERKQAEEKLLTSQLQLVEAADLAKIAHWERDGATDEFIFNDAFYELYGTTAEQEGGYRMAREEYRRRFVHPDDLEELRRQVDENRARPRTDDFEQYEHRAIRRDGEVIHILNRSRVTTVSEGRILKVIGVNQDITARKHAEERTEHLASYPQLNPDPIIEVDISGKITFSNPSTQALLEKLGLDIGDPKSLLPGDLDAILRDWDKKSESTFDRDVSLSDRILGETVHLLPQFSVARLYANDITDRKRAEEALRTSLLQLAGAADMARIAYWEQDGTTGEYLFNDSFYALYGTTAVREGGYRMTREEHRRRFIPQEDREKLRREANEKRGRPRTGDVEQHEHRVIRGDGEMIHILTRHRIVMDSEGRILKVVGVNQDITARKEMEEELRESETKLRAILDGSRDAIGVSKDGIRTFVNPAYLSLFGYESADEMIGTSIFDTLVPESREFVEEVVKRHVGGESVPSFYEETALRKDGTSFLVEVNASTYALKGEYFTLAILRDITERKKALKRLEEAEERFRKIFEESPLGIVMVGSNHRFVRANAAFCRMLGYTEQELIALTFEAITHPGHIAEDALHVKELFGGNIALYRTEKRYVRKDKEVVWGSSTVTIVYDESGEFLYFLTMVEDITQRKQAEGEKATLEEQLRQAQKMEAVGTLAGGVAHDFNNILTVIMGLGNLMQMEIEKDDINRPYVDQIVASSERAADLTQSLLAFSRKQRITLEPHEVNGVVTNTAKLLTRLLPEDIGLSMNLANKDTSSLLDVTQIGQVLMNLATNARDAMPHGGVLTVTTGRAKIDKAFINMHGFGRVGEYVRLSVSDTGTGMDEHIVKRIFEPFFTTKEVGKGTGLGLASAYGIVKQHKGYITVSSTPFEGTTFDIYLPLIKTPSRQRARAKGEIKGGTETILIVEDDRDVRNMLIKILESHGYATIEAIDGDDAIRVHHVHKEHIDLIILDVVMPGKNGKEALEEITRANPLVKAIFTSGYTGDVVIDKGILSESVDFLHKPLSVATLLAKVREVLDR